MLLTLWQQTGEKCLLLQQECTNSRVHTNSVLNDFKGLVCPKITTLCVFHDLVTFCNSRCHSDLCFIHRRNLATVFIRGWILWLNSYSQNSSMDEYCGHMLQFKKEQQHTPYCSCGVIQLSKTRQYKLTLKSDCNKLFLAEISTLASLPEARACCILKTSATQHSCLCSHASGSRRLLQKDRDV